MPLIAICGSQGQGKTTVLASLAEMGYNVIYPKTSRTILTEWGMTLNEVNKSAELTKKFQDQILDRHHELNSVGISSNEIYFTERSYADVFTYTILALGSFNEYSEWLDSYYDRCKELQSIYDMVIKLGGREATVEDDGIRSVNKQFSTIVDLTLTHYLMDFGGGYYPVNVPDHDSRISEIRDLTKFMDV